MKTKTLFFILNYCLAKANDGPNNDGYEDQYGNKETSIESKCQQVNYFLYN